MDGKSAHMDIPEWTCKRFLEKEPFDGDITDDYDYPTDEFLKWVSTYDIGIYEMFIRLPVYLNYIFGGWKFSMISYDGTTCTLEMSTGGWSGNEDIIRAMKDNVFWVTFWQSTARGGHYVFDLSPFVKVHGKLELTEDYEINLKNNKENEEE